MFCKPKKSNEEHLEYTKYFQRTIKLLLLGTGESGKTTIIKQMKILHINGFTNEEKVEKIKQIRQNVHESIYAIVDSVNKIEPNVDLQSDQAKEAAKFILNIGSEEPEAYTDEYFDNIKILWQDAGIRETFKRSNEYQLIDSAEHFLNRIDEIRNTDYIPNILDILYCRKMTVGISKIEFSMSVPKKYGGGTANFWMFDVGGQRGERKKWIRVFEGIEAILFLIAVSDFDQTLREDNMRNRLEESLELFENTYRSTFCRDAGLIVFLNKQDILERKIKEGRQLEKYFPDFKNYVLNPKECSDINNTYERAKFYMKQKILDVQKIPLTVSMLGFMPGRSQNEKLPPRDIYVHFTIATDTRNIKRVFESVQSIILEKTIKTSFAQPF